MMKRNIVCAAFAACCLLPTTTHAIEISFALSDPALGMPGGYFHPGSPEGIGRVTALSDVATYIESVITNPGTLTFELDTFTSMGSTLASGGEYYAGVSPTASGIIRGDAQKEAILGAPVAGANGKLSFNTTKMFYTGASTTVPDGFHDFRSVALHELTHAMGWASALKPDKTSSLTDVVKASDPVFYAGLGELFTPYDTLMVDSAELPLILPDGTANPMAEATLGAKIASANATAAYGTLVPTATTFLTYDLTHLAGSVSSIMNPTLAAGVAKREWTSVDLAILKDLGYAVVPAPSSLWVGLCGAVPGVVWLRRRRTTR
jgi:hypothetical protein